MSSGRKTGESNLELAGIVVVGTLVTAAVKLLVDECANRRATAKPNPNSISDSADRAGVSRPDESRDVWADFNHRQEFEHDLINRKTTWWLAAQTILLATYGAILTRGTGNHLQEYGEVLAVTGLIVAGVTFVGVLAVVLSKFLSYRSYRAFYGASENSHLLPRPMRGKPLQWGVHTRNTIITLAPDVLLPWIFAGAWLALIVRT